MIGRFYDEKGEDTEYAKLFAEKINQCLLEKEIAKKEDAKLPPCNMEWIADKGTKVWCTKSR